MICHLQGPHKQEIFSNDEQGKCKAKGMRQRPQGQTKRKGKRRKARRRDKGRSNAVYNAAYLLGQALGWHAQGVLLHGHCHPAAHQSKGDGVSTVHVDCCEVILTEPTTIAD